jgi:hypothetical protein
MVDPVALLKKSKTQLDWNDLHPTPEVEEWNEWRRKNRRTKLRLDDEDFSGLNLSYTNFREASLQRADFSSCELVETDFVRSNLQGASFVGSLLYGALLDQAKLNNADLRNSTLWWITLVETDLSGADLSRSRVYGVSPWRVTLTGAKQNQLDVSRKDEALFTIDDIEVAHFMDLLVSSQKLRNIINAATSKIVLILGRFTPNERKTVLNALRVELRKLDYLPVIFDFEKPTDRDYIETVMALAGLAKFIIADITQPKSSPLESHATITAYMVPFIPIIQEGEWPFSMIVDLQRKHHWVENTLRYKDKDDLVKYVGKIVARAEAKHSEIQLEKARVAQRPLPGAEW